MPNLLQRLTERYGQRTVIAVGVSSAAAVVILIVAIAVAASGGNKKKVTIAGGTSTTVNSSASTAPGETVPSGGAATTIAPGQPGYVAPAGTTGGTKKSGSSQATAPAVAGATPTTAAGGDRTGVSASEIKYGLHAPVTLNGAPWGLADQPIKGVKASLAVINATGINGRKVVLDIADDKYTVDGGNLAAKQLVDNDKNFFVEGTLGVDQIAAVAKEAHARGVPYMGGGGSEAKFKLLNMFQVLGSYDTHVIKLADFMATSPALKGKKVGVSYLDSPYISPIVQVFQNQLAKHGMQIVAKGAVQKPTEQTDYTTEIQDFKTKGVEVFVPLQDPVTTSRQIAQCNAQLCTWNYTFSDFAHDGEAELALMGNKWGQLKVRGLSGGCYYLAPQANDTTKCAQMAQSHAVWAKTYGELDWQKNGGTGAGGYTLVHFWLKAMKDAGPDLTRLRFVAALKTYNNYDDLVSGPITFAGSSNYSHGYEKMAVFEAQLNLKYKMVSDGLVSGF